jgi:hypothetical protein
VRRLVIAFSLVLVAAVPIACTSLDDLATDNTSATDAGDAGDATAADSPSSDASAEATTTDSASVDAALGDNLHPFGTFEQGCAPWYAYQSTASADSVAHGDAQSCKVCWTSGTTYFGADDTGFLANPPLGRYHAEAWVRQVAGATIPPGVMITLRTKIGTSMTTFPEKAESVPITVSITWARIEVDLVVTQAAEKLNVVVGSASSPDACFLVDDVRVFRVQ